MYLTWSFELLRSVPIHFFIRSGGVPRTAGHLVCSAYRHPARPHPTPSIELGYRCVPCIAMTAPIQGTPQYPSWDPDHFFDGIYSTWCMTRFFGHTKTKSGHMSRSPDGFESGPCLYIRTCVQIWAYVQIPSFIQCHTD